MVTAEVRMAHLAILDLNKRLFKLRSNGKRFERLHEEVLPELRKISRRLIPKLS